MRKVLEEGIWLGGLHFQFLAFSSSQVARAQPSLAGLE
jgi:hypothetical protein